MLVVVQKRSGLLIVAGLSLFPVAWLALVTAQGVYFGPMRSVFEKAGRRFLDDLPFGWGLFDILFYLLPVAGFALILVGATTAGKRRQRVGILFVVLGVLVVVAVRVWGPGYL
jgi:hypothetical protein